MQHCHTCRCAGLVAWVGSDGGCVCACDHVQGGHGCPAGYHMLGSPHVHARQWEHVSALGGSAGSQLLGFPCLACMLCATHPSFNHTCNPPVLPAAMLGLLHGAQVGRTEVDLALNVLTAFTGTLYASVSAAWPVSGKCHWQSSAWGPQGLLARHTHRQLPAPACVVWLARYTWWYCGLLEQRPGSTAVIMRRPPERLVSMLVVFTEQPGCMPLCAAWRPLHAHAPCVSDAMVGWLAACGQCAQADAMTTAAECSTPPRGQADRVSQGPAQCAWCHAVAHGSWLLACAV
jgi:hypothetical protein